MSHGSVFSPNAPSNARVRVNPRVNPNPNLCFHFVLKLFVPK